MNRSPTCSVSSGGSRTFRSPIEVRFITVSDNFFEQIGVDFDFQINSNAVGKHTTFAFPNPSAELIAVPGSPISGTTTGTAPAARPAATAGTTAAVPPAAVPRAAAAGLAAARRAAAAAG